MQEDCFPQPKPPSQSATYILLFVVLIVLFAALYPWDPTWDPAWGPTNDTRDLATK